MRAILSLVVLSHSLSVVQADAPPNFLVIMADDLGAAELACYGNKKHKTPHLDRMAKEGVRYRTCFSTPICSPTRVMLMTGRYGFRTGWYNFTGRPGSPTYKNPGYDLGKAEQTFADLLKANGYATALAGKWQLTGKAPTLVHDCGFDEYRIWAYKHNLPPGVKHTGAWQGRKGGTTSRFWHPSIMTNGKYTPTRPNDYGPDLFTDFLIDFMKRHRDKPFCAYYSMALTHTPWDPAPDPQRPGKKTPKGLKYNVESMDRIIGRLMESLDDLGLSKRTIVIFTGDNGTQKAGKGFPTEQGARVPLIVRCPGTVRQGAVTDAMADLTDILPTLAEFAGVELPKDRAIDGISLVPELKGIDGPRREWAFSYLHEKRILRTGQWLLEGNGKFYFCGNNRNGNGYKDVTTSQKPEVLQAREHFEQILKKLPAPKGLKPCPYLTRLWKKKVR